MKVLPFVQPFEFVKNAPDGELVSWIHKLEIDLENTQALLSNFRMEAKRRGLTL